MRLATWNVNSIRARLDTLLAWLDRRQPDVVCLQETKVVDELFPRAALADFGYTAAISGEKTYNGVAILSREPLTDVQCVFPLEGNTDCRLIAGTLRGLRVYCAYFPHGRDPLGPTFLPKLAWIEGLGNIVFADRNPLIVMGDFNVAYDPRDVFDPIAMEGIIHYTPEERAAVQRLLDRGLVDAFRLRHEEGGHYTWWDYRQGSFRRNLGWRIDHAFVTPDLVDRVSDAVIDKEERAKPQASDHVPLVVELDV
jgi:exodeoxyribonuclease III